eukprot:gnl/Trimastix_PCT/418.p1 GENE.gnl/Trimastix_PCT/418~~gnl/Trimastix_PCT/418.p1  ORF type:complete len:391 (+),score=152.71 gnl/Trimastix_PCT/418:103-1275(+)
MERWSWSMPTEVVFGRNTVPKIGDELKQRNISKVLLTAGKGSIRRNGVYDAVVESFRKEGIEWQELWDIQPNPVVEKVREGGALCKEHGLQAIVAVGGGSVIDSSKAISLAAVIEEDIWGVYEDTVFYNIKEALPLFTILTLSATASEVNAGAVLSNPEKKMKIPHMFNCPVVSIIDPTLQFTLPWNQTVYGAMDAISHILDTSQRVADPAKNDVTLGINFALIKSIIRAADALQQNAEDYDARANLCWACSLALCGLQNIGCNGGDWSVHWLEHALSAQRDDIAHAAGLAAMTPGYITYFQDQNINPLFWERWARDVFGVATVREGVEALVAKLRQWGAPVCLRDAGVSADELPGIVDSYFANDKESSLKPLDRAECLRLLQTYMMERA